MKERPILMNTENVKAILDGRKTQTRRVVKDSIKWEIVYCYENENGHWAWFSRNHPYQQDVIKCPYGQVGGKLWVRETWASDCICENPKCNGVIYKAGYSGVIIPDKWRPSIFMPRWASRITLEITGIRVQRVQDISDSDIQAEGCQYPQWQGSHTSWTGAYKALWESINGKKYPWSSNPFCFVIEFKKL